MSFRDSEFDEAPVESRVSKLKGVVTAQLPSGFQWQVTETSDGERTVNLVDVTTGRTILFGM